MGRDEVFFKASPGTQIGKPDDKLAANDGFLTRAPRPSPGTGKKTP
jgi:hypothetical protein